MIAATLCPKCDYTRLPTDTAPDWQCPSCGVVYAKARKERPRPAAAPKDDRVAGPLHVGQGTQYACVPFYLGLPFAAFILSDGSGRGWLVALPVIMASAFFFWARSYRAKRAVLDVPTSKARSAAQGYVELHGTVESLPGRTLPGPLTLKPCVWYHYGVVEGTGKNARVIEQGSASAPFLLRDETGTCLVDPREAWVICDQYAHWQIENRHYSEWSVREGDPVYAIGEFRSDPVQLDGVVKESTARLRAWLRDPKTFFARFDRNRDGKVSRAELNAASEAARREALEGYTAQGGKHRLAAPGDSRPYIVANWPHDKVAGHFTSATTLHLMVCVIAAGFLVYHLR